MNINNEIKQILQSLIKKEKPEIILRGTVDGDMEEYIFWTFAYLRSVGSPEVLITIDSGGGDSDMGHSIYNIIKMYQGNTVGVVIDRAHSAMSMILQACKVRKMTTRAKMIIHNPSGTSVSLDELECSKKLLDLKKDLRTYQKFLVDCYTLRSCKSVAEIKKTISKRSANDGTASTIMDID